MTASLAGPAIGADSVSTPNGELWVYVGTYTKSAGAKSTVEGINFFRFDLATGRATQPKVVAKMQNPSFLARHPTRPVIYAISEVNEFGGEKAGAAAAFAVEAKTGRLTLLNQQSSGGSGPCYASVDHSGLRAAGSQLRRRIRRQFADRIGRPLEAAGLRRSAPRIERESAAADRTVCPLLRGRPGKPLCPGRRPGHRQSHALSARCREGKFHAERAGVYASCGRRGTAACGISSQWPVRLPDQRIELHDLGFPLRRRPWNTGACAGHRAANQHTPCRIPRRKHDCRDPDRSLGPVCLWLESRPQQHRHLCR